MPVGSVPLIVFVLQLKTVKLQCFRGSCMPSCSFST